jgi:uncharacterized coiled-coil protein SlyX
MKFMMAVVLMVFLAGTVSGQTSETENLKRQVAEQERQITELQQKLARLEEAVLGENSALRALLQPAAGVTPVNVAALGVQPPAPSAPLPVAKATPTAAAAQAQNQPQAAGFRFGGDFRFRFDAAFRDSSPTTAGLQNVRQRYRFRFNIDRDITSDMNAHVQLATGAVNNGITFDQDFAGAVTRHPFFISEAYVEYRPDKNLTLRGGKLEEVFADNSRFLWDDDVRFNGFNERLKLGKVEFRGGQYLFVNPNTFSVAPGSPLTIAGVQPGTMARSAAMFHQGMVIDHALSATWKGQFITDAHIYRNPNLIALTSNATGVTVTVNPAIGLTLSGPAPGTGNATTSPTNTILAARHYQVIRAAYKLDAASLAGKTSMPLSLYVQVARNVGTSQLRDAVMGTVSIGRTQEKGDVRGLYTFAIKDANSMISQLTDDDLGTGVGTNIATNHFRVDYALRRGLVFQNLVFRQKERRSSNPADSFFVPLGKEAPTTWRYQGQLAISF